MVWLMSRILLLGLIQMIGDHSFDGSSGDFVVSLIKYLVVVMFGKLSADFFGIKIDILSLKR